MFIYWEADEMGQKNGGMALRSAAKQTAKKKGLGTDK